MRIFDDLRYAHIYAYMRILADGYRHMAVSVRHQKSGMRGNPSTAISAVDETDGRGVGLYTGCPQKIWSVGIDAIF